MSADLPSRSAGAVLGAGSPDAWGTPPAAAGRYTLYGKIAAGGMATVHIGRLLGPVGFSRTVAIKRLHPHLAEDPSFVLAFVDEARLAARIRHPNVVPTLDVVADGKQLLLVMEYVAGESLVRLMRVLRDRGELMPTRIAASILSSALHGLHAAHEATNDHGEPLQIVHRDVSPHNILVGSDGVTRVLDFGVAKAMGRLQSTGDGAVKGKVAYMSPEQVRGAGVDRRCDVYAAGVVLWEMLAGRRLFDAETQVEVFGRVLAGCTTPPSAFAAGLPGPFDDVTMRALRLDPSERFGSAREMALALEACAGIATPSEVGPWLVSLADDVLKMRARAVAEVESSSGVVANPPAADVVVGDGGVTAVATTIGAEEGQSELVAAGVPRRRLGLVGALTVSVLGALLGAALFLTRSTGGSTHSTPAAVREPPPTVAAPLPSIPPPPPVPGVSSAGATSTANPPASASSARPPAASSAPRPRARPSCVPPYTIDDNGFRVPKPECL